MSNMIAVLLLDFGGTGSVCHVVEKEFDAMDAHLAEATIKSYLTEIRSRLDTAAGIGPAADACASAGFHEKGLEVALDTEQLLYEARQRRCLMPRPDQPRRSAKLGPAA